MDVFLMSALAGIQVAAYAATGNPLAAGGATFLTLLALAMIVRD